MLKAVHDDVHGDPDGNGYGDVHGDPDGDGHGDAHGDPDGDGYGDVHGYPDGDGAHECGDSDGDGAHGCGDQLDDGGVHNCSPLAQQHQFIPSIRTISLVWLATNIATKSRENRVAFYL